MSSQNSPQGDAAPRVNVADRLCLMAAAQPDAVAVVQAAERGDRSVTFGRLDSDSLAIADGLIRLGAKPGDRLALLVRPGVEFVTLVFALLRAGVTLVLVDAGLGRKNIVRCLASTAPDGFVGIPQAHALRVLLRRRFPRARLNVTVGGRWFWGGATYAELLRDKSTAPSTDIPHTAADDPAAIVFTSGSTGPPKGVLYTHQTFVTQCEEIQNHYGIRPGEMDLACFPLFGLFNVACGVTTVFPPMDFSRPARCDPKKLIAAARRWGCQQAFASPAVWDRLSRHCERTSDKLPTLRKVFSCGAPVPAKVIRRTLACVHPQAELHTPYGATEALPVATIEAKEILGETAALTDQGAGVCVGRRFDSIDWRVIRITDGPIETFDRIEELPAGEIGELIVRGLQVSASYCGDDAVATRVRGNSSSPSFHNLRSKIVDGGTAWHRMGDVGYFDTEGRFWYCGRKSQRVVTRYGTLFTECIEWPVNTLPGVARSALVGVGPQGEQAPVLVVEPATWGDQRSRELLTDSILDFAEHTQGLWSIRHVLLMRRLPTDIRHNSKIQRERLAAWAAARIPTSALSTEPPATSNEPPA